MNEEQRSIRDKFKDVMLGKAKKRAPSIAQTLGEHGVKILSDQKLDKRIELLEALEEVISEPINTAHLDIYVKELKSRLDLLHYSIYKVAAPYARSGTIPRMARALYGWSVLYAEASSWLLWAENMVLENDIPKPKKNGQAQAKDQAQESTTEAEEKAKIEDHQERQRTRYGVIDVRFYITSLHDALVKHIYKDALFFLGVCFFDKDVSESAATVIQTAFQQMRPGEGLNQIQQPGEEQ
jgi:hypothetical protein